MLAFDVRLGIGQLQRIVNDYDVPAATGYRSVYTTFRTDIRPEWLQISDAAFREIRVPGKMSL